MAQGCVPVNRGTASKQVESNGVVLSWASTAQAVGGTFDAAPPDQVVTHSGSLV
jgi:hypothetical protein